MAGARYTTAIAIAAVATVVSAAACGDDPDVGEQRADQVRRAAAEAGLSEEVQDFLVLAVGTADATFQVTYEIDDQTGARRVVVSQNPPDHRLDVVLPDGTVDATIRLDDDAYQCRQERSDWQCGRVEVPTPEAAIFDAIELANRADELAAGTDDYDFAVEGRTLLGVEARCLVTTLKPGHDTDPSRGDEGTLCLSPAGVVLLVDNVGTRQEATAYTTDVPDGAFDLPAEAGNQAPSTTPSSTAVP
ncbi:MAG: hypothetical protein ACRD29_03590 [Acidimicrobiales bacterium]